MKQMNLIIGTVCLMAIMGLCGVIALPVLGHTIPEQLSQIVVSISGGLLGSITVQHLQKHEGKVTQDQQESDDEK